MKTKIFLCLMTAFSLVSCTKQNEPNNPNAKGGALVGRFSIGEGKQVYFSQGNLQYRASSNTWRFAENQYDTLGCANQNISSTYEGWIDLFGWGTSGYNNKYPYMTSINPFDYGDGNNDIADTEYDYGYHNKISNGGNKKGEWRTLTYEEWFCLLHARTDASNLKGRATVNGVHGIIILPDGWNCPPNIIWSGTQNGWSANQYAGENWIKMELSGAVFLPCAGYRHGTDMTKNRMAIAEDVYTVGEYGRYWTSSYQHEDKAYSIGFEESNGFGCGFVDDRCEGLSVRLVKDVK